jgi:Leucine-rich repeat (LRR) protein
MCDIEVVIVQARGLAPRNKKTKTASPYAQVLVGKQKKKSKAIKDTLSPQWNEPFTIDIGDAANFAIVVNDKNGSGKMEFMGGITLGVNGLKLNGEDIWYKLGESKKGKKIGVKGEVMLRLQLPEPKGQPLSKSDEKALKANIDAAMQRKDGILSCEGCKIVKTPAVVQEKMTDLREIHMGFNKIADWPRLTMFTQLQVLNLAGNQIVTVPPELSMLSALRELYLNGNMLKVLPPELGDCRALEKLDISNNLLPRLVADIGCLTKLEDLNATGNPMTEIPDTLGECCGLETLDLSCCELTQIPDQFGYLTRLMELNLGNNALTKLPDTVGRMTRLVVCNLSDNKLTDLPVTLGYCVGLGKLGSGINIDRNPIKDSGMVKKWKIGPDHLMDYLEKRVTVQGSPKVPEVMKTDINMMRGGSSSTTAGSASSASAGSAAASNKPATPKAKRSSTKSKSSSSGGKRSTKATPTGAAGKEEKPSTPTIPRNNNASPASLASPSFGTPAAAAEDPMHSKLLALALWVEKTVNSDVNPKVRSRVASLNQETELSAALGYAGFVSIMKNELETAKALMGGAGVLLPPVPSHPPQGSDKLSAVKAAVGNALLEVCDINDCMISALVGPNLTQARVVAFVQILKKMQGELAA